MSIRFSYYKEDKLYKYFKDGISTRIYIKKNNYNVFHVVNGELIERSFSTLKGAKMYIIQNYSI